jgi:hypothetical protein
MGKSRTLDELGKKHFVIPINLRSATSTGVHLYFTFRVKGGSHSFIRAGFPPADHAVRDFLSKARTQREAYTKACAFLEALFDKTAQVVKTNCAGSKNLRQYAGKFRKLLTEGQKMQKHNSFRETFYGEVVHQAELKVAAREKVSRHINLIRP